MEWAQGRLMVIKRFGNCWSLFRTISFEWSSESNAFYITMQSQYRQLNAKAMRTISAFCLSGFMRPIYWVPSFLSNLLEITKISSSLGSEFKSRNFCSDYKHKADACAFPKIKEFHSLRILGGFSRVPKRSDCRIHKTSRESVHWWDPDSVTTHPQLLIRFIHQAECIRSSYQIVCDGAFIAKMNEQLNLHEKRFTKKREIKNSS